MPRYAYLILLAGIVLWFYPFVPAHQKTGPASVVDRTSRWGMLLQLLAFTLLWQGKFWIRSLPPWRTLISGLLFALAITLSWTSSRALSGQLRADAALGADHRLIRSGPYGLVRNPIYLSMLLLLCAVAIMITSWRLFLAALVIFLIGTEIRVRTEEKLLTSRFGPSFQDYKKKVSAYIPFLRISTRS
jgi:protein-S-isoprenylcysteine O-methyltransferase Ste14